MRWMRMRGSALLVALGALLTGCGTRVEFLQTHAPPRMWAARPPESVEILVAGPPQRPYVEVGMLEAQQASAYSVDPPHVVLAKLRERAAQLGCDAIVVTGNNDSIGHLGLTGRGAVMLKGYRAACVMYPAPDSAAPAAER